MLYNVKWTRNPYFDHNNLRSIDIDYSNEEIGIFLQINEKKEYTYKIKAYSIDKIQFCVGYNREGVKSVFYMVHYNKGNKNSVLAFYLPRNYDKDLFNEVRKFAKKYKITYLENKSINPIFLILSITVFVIICNYIYNLLSK